VFNGMEMFNGLMENVNGKMFNGMKMYEILQKVADEKRA
jgi:hypothetical protein